MEGTIDFQLRYHQHLQIESARFPCILARPDHRHHRLPSLQPVGEPVAPAGPPPFQDPALSISTPSAPSTLSLLFDLPSFTSFIRRPSWLASLESKMEVEATQPEVEVDRVDSSEGVTQDERDLLPVTPRPLVMLH